MQEVIAAITMSPSFKLKSVPSTLVSLLLSLFVFSLKTFLKSLAASDNKTLFCGFFGPEILGTTFDKSKLIVSENNKSLVDHKFCSFAYVSTRDTVSLSLPEKFKYLIVSSSIGKKPHVAPYSGAIFAIVALSASVKFFNPSP